MRLSPSTIIVSRAFPSCIMLIRIGTKKLRGGSGTCVIYDTYAYRCYDMPLGSSSSCLLSAHYSSQNLSRSLTSPHLPGKLVESRIIHLDPSHMFIPLSIISFMHRLGGDLVLEVLSVSISCVMSPRMETYRCFLKSGSLCGSIDFSPLIPVHPLLSLFLTLRPCL